MVRKWGYLVRKIGLFDHKIGSSGQKIGLSGQKIGLSGQENRVIWSLPGSFWEHSEASRPKWSYLVINALGGLQTKMVLFGHKWGGGSGASRPPRSHLESRGRPLSRSARVLRRGENLPGARPTIGTRIPARGEHSARAANDPHAYCCAGRTFRARGDRSAPRIKKAHSLHQATLFFKQTLNFLTK